MTRQFTVAFTNSGYISLRYGRQAMLTSVTCHFAFEIPERELCERIPLEINILILAAASFGLKVGKAFRWASLKGHDTKTYYVPYGQKSNKKN